MAMHVILLLCNMCIIKTVFNNELAIGSLSKRYLNVAVIECTLYKNTIGIISDATNQ